MLRKTCWIVGKFCGTKGIWNNCDTSVSSTMKGNFLSSMWVYMWLSITQGLMVLFSRRFFTYYISLFPQSKKHVYTLFTLSVDGTWTSLCRPPDHTFFKNLVVYLIVNTCFLNLLLFSFQAFLHRIRQTADDQQCLSPEHVKVWLAFHSLIVKTKDKQNILSQNIYMI